MATLLEFRTDAAGAPLLDGGRLRPNSTYVIEPQRRRISNRLDRPGLAAWIDDAVIGDLETLLQGIDSREQHSTRGEGNFLLLAGCLMALEYFATIFVDPRVGAKSRVEQFAHRFLASINGRYALCWDVLWPAARNGILHGSWPSRVRTAAGDEYRFAVGCEADCPHLQLVASDDPSERRPALWVNARRMLEDLRSCVVREDGFKRWIVESADDAAMDRGQPFIIEASSEEALNAWR